MAYSLACLWAGCGRFAFARGLCTTHYTTALRLVRKGAVSWEQLEEDGRAKAPRTLEQRRKDRKEIFRRKHGKRPGS